MDLKPCYKKLAQAVLDLARKDLNSTDYYVQSTAILFFESGEHLDLICSLAEAHPTMVLKYLPEFERVEPKLGRLKSRVEIYRNGRWYRTVLGHEQAARVADVSSARVSALLKSGGKTKDGYSFRRSK